MPVEEEVRSQIEVLASTANWFETGDFSTVLELLKNNPKILFIGCGSSYYIALSASRYFTGKIGKTASALPAGEIVMAREWNLPKSDGTVAVLISRSGETTEVLEAAEIFKKLDVPTIGLTLEEKSDLARIADFPVILPYDEKSVVMTRSFTGMLLALELFIDEASGKRGEQSEILKRLRGIFEDFEREAKEFSSGKHYVFLGAGPYEGIARESALKLQEMSLTTTESYSTLEYRHGPKSLVEPGVVVVIYGDGEHEERLAGEIEKLGGTSVIRKRLSERYEDMFVQVIFAQLLGLEIAKRKGVDVENPRNLTKVVKL